MAKTPTLSIFSETNRGAAESLLSFVQSLGEIEVQEKKTSLHVVAGRAAFLGVHPRKNGVRVNIVLARGLEGERIVKSEQVSKTRFHNELDLESGAPIDRELASWIKEAFRLQTNKS